VRAENIHSVILPDEGQSARCALCVVRCALCAVHSASRLR
jgi:hypothetical protein